MNDGDEPELIPVPKNFCELLLMCRGETRGEWYSNRDLERLTGVRAHTIGFWSYQNNKKHVPGWDVALEFLESLGYKVYLKHENPDIIRDKL